MEIRMVTFTYTIGAEHGLHARPAGMLVNCAKRFESEIRIAKGEKSADAKKLLAVMSLGGKRGDELTFTLNGSDESVAAEALQNVCQREIG